MTTINEAKKAINDRFTLAWGVTTLVTKDNAEFTTPTEREPWVRLTIRHTGGNQETLGKKTNRKYERRGKIFVSIFVDVDIGTSLSDSLGKTAQDIFEGESFDGVTVNDTVIREIGANDIWFHVIMEADFLYNEIK